MKHYHAAIWIDHEQARVYSLNWAESEEWTIHPHDRHLHLHHKAGKGDAGRTPSDQHYFQSVAEAVRDAGEILITGPGSAKLELLRHLQKHAPDVEKKVVSVETLDHPSDGQLVAFARKFLLAADRIGIPATAHRAAG
jgi:hypothetical protein